MTRDPTHRQPTINSTGTRRLAIEICAMRRRQPALDDTVQAIRIGNECVLHALVVGAQRGDSDAALTAIWALLPRLAAVVISRLPIQEWHRAIDEYLTFTYLTIIDVDADKPPFLLGDKIISRTRRRSERALEFDPVVLCEPSDLPTTTSKNASSRSSASTRWPAPYGVGCSKSTLGTRCSEPDLAMSPALRLHANARWRAGRSAGSSSGRGRPRSDLTPTHDSEIANL